MPEEDFGADVLVGLSAVGQRFVETTLSTLINDIAELPYQVVLVLDDYQFVTEEGSHETVAFFVEHLPENIHLVISGRSDPPLPLGRMRARAEMNEIRAEQLTSTTFARLEPLAHPRRVAGALAGTSRAWRPSRG